MGRSILGFTLLELLAVVGILALLAAILFPVFALSRRAALRTTCVSNLRQVGLAVNMYRQDNEELPPYLSAARAYIKEDRLFLCPRDQKKGQHDPSGSVGNAFRLEGNYYLPSGVSYTYVPNWAIARQLGWWEPGPPYGDGKWYDLTPLSECHWHWATFFQPQWQQDNIQGGRGWIMILTLSSVVRKIRAETPPAQFSPENYQ